MTQLSQLTHEQDVLMKITKRLLLSILLFTLSLSVNANSKPPIQLPTKYQQKNVQDIRQYWVSEKLDGVRGYWNGKELFTKGGHKLSTPVWFTKNWPTTALDGELWINRNTFEQVVSCVRRKIAEDCWLPIRFMIFDLPKHKGTFTERLTTMKNTIPRSLSPYLAVVPQLKLTSDNALFKQLDNIVDNGGEGLMLHYQHAFYTKGRSSHIVKLKRYIDAEAVVIKHLPGKGKYTNLLGAIQVKTKDGIVFKIGSGFTDKERENPPPIGSTITFKYVGKTQRGVPKFASFLRQRIIGNH